MTNVSAVMDRRMQLENIIIGTLLESDDEKNYFDDCRCCLTPDMFKDDTNRRIFQMVAEMNAKGVTNTDPSNILAVYGDSVIDIICDMTERVNEYSFVYKMAVHNEMTWMRYYVDGTLPKYSQVTFTDYVNKFIEIVYAEK